MCYHWTNYQRIEAHDPIEPQEFLEVQFSISLTLRNIVNQIFRSMFIVCQKSENGRITDLNGHLAPGDQTINYILLKLKTLTFI